MVKESDEQRAEFLRFLKLAMSMEREGVKFYTKVKLQVDDFNMSQLMKVIMDQEREHLRIVTEVYNAEKKDGIEEAAKKAASYKKQKPLETPFSAMKHFDSLVKKKVSIHRLFEKAVEFEEGIAQLYRDIMQSTKNPKVKSLLKKLAEEEDQHKEFIQMHGESIYNDGHWYGWDHVRLQS